MTVREIIKDRKEIYCISNQASAAEAARYLKDRGIRATGVCDAVGKVCGVVSQSDISDKVVAENFKPSDVAVETISSKNLIKVTPDVDINSALKLMHDRGVYHLIVEDAAGTFLGMVSVRDCVAMCLAEEKERADLYQAYAFPNY